MKKLLSLCLFALLLPLAVSANSKFVEGKHYQVIAEQASAKPVVKEYFSFFCGGCYGFEPVAQSLAKKLPDNAEFKKVHVDFIRAASPEIQDMLARAYLVGKNMGKGDQVASAIFNQIHRSRVPFVNEDDVRSLMLINDIPAEEYEKAMRSFSIRGAANQMKKEQNELSESRVLSSVPMLVVNDKYKILNESLNQRNLENELQELISYLLQKDA
ncbi:MULTISPECIES: thiol:disulfide interchange protein DsbA/DsbL [unclassified Arsukibacterium]|uniref:thiol:disulfide interchange protein DsbA/DsbL n=1 Tax=unclassified Arsukibacterium TaxID=2635278 RepID=UPI000C6B2B9D|nr:MULTISPECIES: thiol:disulfide interchange protein DsbA/DsbL [unclassified Arsukibacterium]MAA94643.1 protein-disulfide isomerase [Rheinheimera sp.]MBM32773.1 protein-disulfide isomerase [Rheinheimera sp.]HAW93405.1 protein-disulfide isomerase [Candidatus Azambacteria bacterium]|tara:strand:- start:785 stop:1426 length:642 start_codon:yes stop_codon:yes gene_type:complete